MAVRVPLPLVTAGMRLAQPLVDAEGLPPAERRGALAELHAAITRHLGARAARLAEGP